MDHRIEKDTLGEVKVPLDAIGEPRPNAQDLILRLVQWPPCQ